jgi:hypothetical protein
MWLQAIDERSGQNREIASNYGPCSALIIAIAYTEGAFCRHRRLPDLKQRLNVSFSNKM